MEELVQKIDELIELLKVNSMPLWISIVGIFVPIVLSAVVIGITIYQHKKNKSFQILINAKNEELQKMISDKELKVQMHGDILSIYDNHCLAQNTICKAGNNIALIFANPSILFQWSNELLNAVNLVCQANNRAELLLPQSDEELRRILKNLLDQLRTLCDEINDYINSGKADINRQQAWSTVFATYRIPVNDYNLLSFNINATDTFIKLCSNDDTKKMDNEIKNILSLYDYDKLDKYFEPYLRMYTEKGDK